jgi:radical SAM protein with 4Fe4S-binding SPASM domain
MARLPLLPVLETTQARGLRLPLLEPRDKDRATRPIYAVWELTLKCDLACRHCGSRAGRARPDELSTEEAVQLAHQIADLGVKEVTLIGGEAYLHAGWEEVVRAIRSRNMVCTMTSGGRGITQEMADRMAKAGVQSVSISIDGTEERHDALRGVKGAHAAALAAWKHLRAAGILVSANTQINTRNRQDLRYIRQLIGENGCHGWQVFLTVAMGRATDEEGLLLQPADLLEVMPLLEELHADCKKAGIRLLPGNNIGYFGPGEKALRGGLRSPLQASCGAGRAVLGIEANGDIKGCPSLTTREWVGGNVREYKLVEIWEGSERLRYTRDMTVESHLWGFCRTCYYAEACMGGCTWTSSTLFGKPGNNPYCHHRVLDFANRGLMERLVRVAPARGEAFDHAEWSIVVEPLAEQYLSFTQ